MSQLGFRGSGNKLQERRRALELRREKGKATGHPRLSGEEKGTGDVRACSQEGERATV